MKFKIIIAILLLITATHCAQNYISDEGTSADSFRIGNTRYFTFKLDNDSNFVEMTINGVWKRIADWHWVRKYGIDTTKKWIWLNEHNFKKVVKIDSLFKFGNNGRLELPTYAVMPREIYFDDNDVKYISEDSTEILVNRSYLTSVLDSLLMDSVFVKSNPFIYVKSGYLLSFQGNSGLYLPTYLNDEGMIGHNGNNVLFYNNMSGIDTLASTEWVRNYIDSLPGGTGSYTFAPPLWNIGGQIQLDVASPLFLEENDHLAIKKASASQDGYLSKEDWQTFYSGSTITMKAIKDTIWFNYIQDILSDIVGINSALVAFSISGSGRNVHWNNVTNKPSSFPTSGYTGTLNYLAENAETINLHILNGLVTGISPSNDLTISQWIAQTQQDLDTLFSWGNHKLAGYLKSVASHVHTNSSTPPIDVQTGLEWATVGNEPFTYKVLNVSNYSYLYSGAAAGYIAESWGNHASVGYATQNWVQNQGYLTSSSLNGYATQNWVQNQGYLTSSSLNGYATQNWVQSQGYLLMDVNVTTQNLQYKDWTGQNREITVLVEK